MLDKSMAKISFSKSVEEIKNLICGLNPIMGAYAMYNGKKIKFWKAEILSNEKASNILEKNITEDIEVRNYNRS